MKKLERLYAQVDSLRQFELNAEGGLNVEIRVAGVLRECFLGKYYGP